MGFIKAIGVSASSQLADTYREVIKYNNIDKNILIKKVSTYNGVIQNESRLFVEPGQCAIYTDNGAIKDIITEPGMYFMDTSAPSLFQVNIFKGIGQTFLETMKRVAYEGQTITTQAVYFVSLAEIPSLAFSTVKSLYKDPTWGAMEVSLNGSYGVKVSNPVNLLTNINSNADECYYNSLASQIENYISSALMKSLNSLDVSFDTIPSKIETLTEGILENINRELDTIGISLTRVVVSEINVPEEIRKSMYERTGIKMKATSVTNNEADIYTKLNTAEAIKGIASNPNGAATTIMGMKIGDTIAGVVNKEINNVTANTNTDVSANNVTEEVIDTTEIDSSIDE